MTQSTPNTQRRRLFALLAAALALGAIGTGVYWYTHGSRYVSTDNAYAAAEVAMVTPSVGGTIKEVRVIDTQKVKKGDILVVIDDTDARLAHVLNRRPRWTSLSASRRMVISETPCSAASSWYEQAPTASR